MVTYDARPTTFTPLTTQFEWEKLFEIMGIFDGVGPVDFTPSPPAGGSISVGAGTCVIKGQLWRADAAVSTPLPGNPSAGMSRADLLVIQYNRAASSSPAVVQLLIVTGAPAASNPAIPPLTQNPVGTGGTGVWQIPVAQWTVNNAGTISGFKDIRQFCGRTTALMTSVARPNMTYTRLGLETDTGYLLLYDQNVPGWRGIGPKNQILPSGNTVTNVALSPLFSAFVIPANDVANANLGTVSYRIRCGGGGKQATGAAATFTFSLNAFGIVWGVTGSMQIIPLGAAFTWHWDGELIVNSNGSGCLYGNLAVSQAVSNPGNAQSVYCLNHQQTAGSVNVVAATSAVVNASVSTVNGAPSINCIGATFERIGN